MKAGRALGGETLEGVLFLAQRLRVSPGAELRPSCKPVRTKSTPESSPAPGLWKNVNVAEDHPGRIRATVCDHHQ